MWVRAAGGWRLGARSGSIRLARPAQTHPAPRVAGGAPKEVIFAKLNPQLRIYKQALALKKLGGYKLTLIAVGVDQGLYGGLFTPTEAAIIAVVYGLLVGMVIYRSVSWADLYRIMLDAAVASAVVMFIVAFAGLFAWTADRLGTVDRLARTLLALTDNGLVMILLVNVLLFIAGMLLDAISIYYLFLPIFMPLMRAYGWDPLWFGIVMTFNLAIGQFTPPVAVNLYVTTWLADSKLDQVSLAVAPFVLAMLLGLVLIVLWPSLSIAPALWFGLYQP